MIHDETKLPKWTQKELASLRDELSRLKQAHEVLFDYDGWLTLGVNMKEPHGLFTCSVDGTHRICSIGNGDILLVGRKAKDPS